MTTDPREKVATPAGTASPSSGNDIAGPAHEEANLRDIWRSFSEPRRASCLAWCAFLITWVITRLITIHGKGSSTSAAITIAGHHIHHYMLGLILLGLIAAVTLFWKPPRGWQFLGLGFGVALALILDEYALLLNLSDVYWQSQGRLSVDVVLAFLGAGGAYLAAMTWVHESLRRAGRRARRPRTR